MLKILLSSQNFFIFRLILIWGNAYNDFTWNFSLIVVTKLFTHTKLLKY